MTPRYFAKGLEISVANGRSRIQHVLRKVVLIRLADLNGSLYACHVGGRDWGVARYFTAGFTSNYILAFGRPRMTEAVDAPVAVSGCTNEKLGSLHRYSAAAAGFGISVVLIATRPRRATYM